MGYPMTADADPAKPYVMWPDTPYAHLMIPVRHDGGRVSAIARVAYNI